MTAEDFRRKIDEHTKVILLAAVQEINGFRADVKEIGKLAKEFGCYYIVDGIQEAGALQGEVTGDGISTGMQTAQVGDVNTVACLGKQFFLGQVAAFQVHGEGTDADGGVVTCLGCVAGGLLTGHGSGLQIVQQGLQLTLFDDVLLVGGAALRVKGHGHGAVFIEGVVHQRDAGSGNNLTVILLRDIGTVVPIKMEKKMLLQLIGELL